MEVHELVWGRSDLVTHVIGPAQRGFDVIVASDVAYDDDCFIPLLDTIQGYTDRNPRTQVGTPLPRP